MKKFYTNKTNKIKIIKLKDENNAELGKVVVPVEMEKERVFEITQESGNTVIVRDLKSKDAYEVQYKNLYHDFDVLYDKKENKRLENILKTYYKGLTPNVKGFPNYHVSKDGEVINIEKGKTLKQSIQSTHGYVRVSLAGDNGNKGQFYIQDLVAKAYIPEFNVGDRKFIAFKNGNKKDCRLENLQIANTWKEVHNFSREVNKIQKN